MRKLSVLSSLPLLVLLCTCEPAPPAADYPAFPLAAVTASLEDYRNPAITDRRFKQPDLQPLLDALPAAFAVDTAGRSVEGRPLWRVAWGRGDVEVLLWSQMHGDEPTATAALFDLFAWLGGGGDGLDSLRATLADRLHLTFLPLLNPDGAARYQRRNALGIDLNRDALRLTSPEARLLKGERDRLAADWGFNLHDQGIYYAAGFPGGKGCVLSVLAPAYDWEKSMNERRTDAARLIALLNDVWQREVPDQIGRYNDDFEPRAFGDNLQKWGTRTILIESGGYAGDPEKQEIRRLNLLGLLAGLHGIATGGFAAFSVDDYWRIPENQSNGVHALKLTGGTIRRAGAEYPVDIAYRTGERTLGPDYREHTSYAYVSDVGDLHTFAAFEEVDVAGARVRSGRTYPGVLSAAELATLRPAELYRDGYTAVRVADPPADPPAGLRVLGPRASADTLIEPGRSPDLLVYDGERLRLAVVEGRVFRPD